MTVPGVEDSEKSDLVFFLLEYRSRLSFLCCPFAQCGNYQSARKEDKAASTQSTIEWTVQGSPKSERRVQYTEHATMEDSGRGETPAGVVATRSKRAQATVGGLGVPLGSWGPGHALSSRSTRPS